jgi:hypothetical protein
MRLRLLPFVFLVFLSQAALAQQFGAVIPDGVPETCPVTKPYQTSLFVPPFPYPAKAPIGWFWFGTDRLWTQLLANGIWSGLPHSTPNDPTFGQKLAFGRQGYDALKEPQPNLRVTGRRLDSPAPPLLSEKATNGWVQRDQPFMVTGVRLPTFGCWEITAHYENDELTFVVWVPGDGVMVSKAGIVYVVGDVRKPMGVSTKDTGPITVLNALAIAEGTNPTADLHNVKIIRKGENGHTEVPVDIQKIMQAKAADVTLQDGDILVIPHSGGRRQEDYFYDVPPSGPLQGPIYSR